MLLSKLVYLSIKNVIYQNESDFTYLSFMQGNFDNDIELSMQIVNAFSPLNEAISRLSDLDRIPYRVENKSHVRGVLSLSSLSHPVKEIIGINNGREAVAFKILGDDIILRDYPSVDNVYIEYKEDIKTFSEDDLVDLEEDEYGHVIDHNIDLKDYGLNESMCNYIIEYVKGKLLEPIAPELANLHITTAETYFSNLNPNKPETIQTVVQPKFRMDL